ERLWEHKLYLPAKLIGASSPELIKDAREWQSMGRRWLMLGWKVRTIYWGSASSQGGRGCKIFQLSHVLTPPGDSIALNVHSCRSRSHLSGITLQLTWRKAAITTNG